MKRLCAALVPIACAIGASMPTTPASAQACQLCGDDPPAVEAQAQGRALHIDIATDLDFARYAVLDAAGGSAELDPVTGERRAYGGLGILGGIAVTAHVTLTGEPNRAVVVDLPASIELRAGNGDRIELTNLTSDLPAQPRLNALGLLEFQVGGRIDVDGTDAGDFRGRIRISAQYE